MFNEALSEDLYKYQTHHQDVILLQYVDDLMLAGTTEEACSHATGDLLILTEALAARKDLTDVPLDNSELVWLMDGSSYVKDGQRKAGAAIVDDSGQTIWAETLAPNTCAQKAELIPLIQALELAKEKRETIFTDRGYALALPIFKVQYTKKGDFGQLREKK